MKQLLVLFFLITYFSLSAQTSAPVTPAKTEAKTPAKSPESKTTEAKSTDAKPADAKSTEAKAPAKKELPPLPKEGGFFVLNNVKWQADNITKKAYIVAKADCEKDGLRLPTRDELIDAYHSKYPEFRTPGGYYLSGNRVASDRSNIWFVSFDNGHHNHGSLTREFNVRCVKTEAKQAPAKMDTPPSTVEPKK
ncbi:MAG TPA: hypothetical protein PLX69_03400 [Leptospiraceae bacterium]|nr:hypothetical protein [Leptospiraceae bacterium]